MQTQVNQMDNSNTKQETRLHAVPGSFYGDAQGRPSFCTVRKQERLGVIVVWVCQTDQPVFVNQPDRL